MEEGRERRPSHFVQSLLQINRVRSIEDGAKPWMARNMDEILKLNVTDL